MEVIVAPILRNALFISEKSLLLSESSPSITNSVSKEATIVITKLVVVPELPQYNFLFLILFASKSMPLIFHILFVSDTSTPKLSIHSFIDFISFPGSP